MSLFKPQPIAIATIIGCLAGCVDPDVARRVLSEDGYTNIVLKEHPGLSAILAGCDRHFSLITPFEATLTGRHVSGVVCSHGASGQAPQVRRFE